MKNSRPAPASQPVQPPLPRPDAGIDVSKAHLDADVWPQRPSAAIHIANDDAGCAALVEHFRRLNVRRVVIEATGGYEWRVVDALRDAGFDVRIVNPKRVRDYARSLGILAKTDALDAAVLARYAGQLDEEAPEIPDDHQRGRDRLVTRRRQLIGMRTMEHNHREHTRDPKLIKQIERAVELFDRQIAEVEKLIDESINDDPIAKAIDARLQTVDGIGAVTSRMLITELPQLGRATRREIASLAGVAPFNDDSGPRRGKKRIQGGRGRLRSALFMPILTATQKNPVISAYYYRLRDAGKGHFTAMIACMRKMIIHLNTLVRETLQKLTLTPSRTP